MKPRSLVFLAILLILILFALSWFKRTLDPVTGLYVPTMHRAQEGESAWEIVESPHLKNLLCLLTT